MPGGGFSQMCDPLLARAEETRGIPESIKWQSLSRAGTLD